MLQKRTLPTVVFAFLLIASLAAAQATHEGVTTINGGRSTIYLKGAPQTITPAAQPSAGLIKIFSNLGSGSNVYDPVAGTGVLGRNVPGQPRPEWLAFAFTPVADHVVQQIQVGATYVSGTNELFVSLNDDNAGLPGMALHTWHFVNLPTFGTCCTLQTAKYKTGIPVTGGTQYWVVLRTATGTSDTWDVWNNDFNGQQGKFSNNLGSGWVDGGIQQQGAFGVFGQ